MSEKKLKVIVFTQQDRFFIPTNIIKASKVCDIVEVVNNKSKHSFDNKRSDLINWFGFWQCAKMGIVQCWKIFEGCLDVISGYRLFGGKRSVEHAAKKIGAKYQVVTNVNKPEFVEYIRNVNPDLIISYSAPQIIKPELLGVPKYGIINVHGALLPNYRGAFPSFWYLYNEENSAGATVHKMSAAIDDGDICLQAPVDISDCKTMYQIMNKTKELGGELMVQTIQKIADGTLETKPNKTSEGSYFSWPTVEQARDFRKKGKRLI